MSTVLDKSEIVRGLKASGVKEGDVVLAHSAMRTFGRIEGGAETVVEALLESVGPNGTVVGPTFTFSKEIEEPPLIEPEKDASEMGAISEAIRRHPRARRSVAYRHSVAAIGRWAEAITEVDPALSPFDLRSSFGIMIGLDTQILLLGVTYANATAFHVCEWICRVPYRHAVARPAKLRMGGNLSDIVFTDYQPKPNPDGSYYGKRTPDFNRVGRILEESGKVGVAGAGNAMIRRFSLRQLFDYSVSEMSRDYNIFRTSESESGRITKLKDGRIVLVPITDKAGRTGRHQMAIRDFAKFAPPAGVTAEVLD